MRVEAFGNLPCQHQTRFVVGPMRHDTSIQGRTRVLPHGFWTEGGRVFFASLAGGEEGAVEPGEGFRQGLEMLEKESGEAWGEGFFGGEFDPPEELFVF